MNYLQIKISIFAAILLIGTTACSIELIYDPAARSMPAYCLAGLGVVMFIVMVVLLFLTTKTNAEG